MSIGHTDTNSLVQKKNIDIKVYRSPYKTTISEEKFNEKEYS